ncbi:uncharacterized protein LOC118427914 isoform X2 [Branchiostoma floridae]|uniref:Uncharacterized protein LOC118427914 isoform X2 n=1 Tax=Branchiostoma floridae TaxID=7739 RepID=A0A9J7M3S6_BRAFL|nr:uncharacterized protein LOC118427914 isoform X2 [Branchiostoma floridae]
MLTHLCCLTDDDKALVQNEARNHGNSRAVVTLLDRVTRREPGWFQQFLSGLRHTGYVDIAEQLEDLSSVPEEGPSVGLEKSGSFTEVTSGTVTGEAVPTGDEGGYQSSPTRPVTLELPQGTGDNTIHIQENGRQDESEPSSPDYPEDTAPWKVALRDLGSQLFHMSGQVSGTVGQYLFQSRYECLAVPSTTIQEERSAVASSGGTMAERGTRRLAARLKLRMDIITNPQ